ncbi:MAG: hypothetical protein WAO07_08845 [Desulfobacterales bacterium]
MDGISLAYTFEEPTAGTRKNTQFFDNNGSRAIYQNGWMACTLGPFIPWDTPGSIQRIANWDSAKDQWELYDLRHDFSQATDLAAQYPDKLEEMKKSFLALAEDNKAFRSARETGSGFTPRTGSRPHTQRGTSAKTLKGCRSLPHWAWDVRAPMSLLRLRPARKPAVSSMRSAAPVGG